MYEDGTPGEIFARMAKEGSVVSGLVDAFATATSIMLQYGVPLEVLVNKFSNTRFEPYGFTTNPKIPIAKSILDYVFRWLGLQFLDDSGKIKRRSEALITEAPAEPSAPAIKPAPEPEKSEIMESRPVRPYKVQTDAPPCPECGSITEKSGACYRCPNCGSTTGCS
jgi:ribonucleoside-diphosphate reductase alpha chain